MKNMQYVVVTAGSTEKLAAKINDVIAKAASVRPCGAPFFRTEDKQWYQALFVVNAP